MHTIVGSVNLRQLVCKSAMCCDFHNGTEDRQRGITSRRKSVINRQERSKGKGEGKQRRQGGEGRQAPLPQWFGSTLLPITMFCFTAGSSFLTAVPSCVSDAPAA